MEKETGKKAQAIIVSGFLIAIGIVAIVVLLNSAVLSVGEQPDTTENEVNSATSYRNTIVTESKEAIKDVNDIAVRKGLTNAEVNATYKGYVENINQRMQEVYSGQGLVGISEIQVNSSFNNAYRARKNKTTSVDSQTRDPIDVVLVLDTSGSMEDCDDLGDKCQEMIEGAKEELVPKLKPLDRISVVDFGSTSGYGEGNYETERGIYKNLIPSYGNKDSINQTLDQLSIPSDTTTGTYLGGGIREALKEFDNNANPSHRKLIIALTDGENTEGWVHYDNKYVYSCIDDESGCESDSDAWEWRHEWGFATDEEYSYAVDAYRGSWVCVSDELGDPDCDYDSGDADDIPEAIDDGYYETLDCDETPSSPTKWRCFSRDSELNQKGLDLANEANGRNVTINTIAYGSDPDEGHLEDIADATNGTQYDADESNIGSVFEQSLDDFTETSPIAAEINRSYRMSLNITDFPGEGDVVLRANGTGSGNLLWRMTVTNRSSSPYPSHVLIDDGIGLVEKYNYSNLGGTPLKIDVLENEINGFNRNMSTNLLQDQYNLTLEYSAAVANLTYDIRVDEDADPVHSVCPNPPCTSDTTQTVGSIHNTSFEISYQNENIDYTEDINITVNPTDGEVSGGGSFPSTTSARRTLNFSTPVYEQKMYYPFDQNSTDGWPDQQAFDATGNNNTMALIGSPDVENGTDAGENDDTRGAYEFEEDDFAIDQDGWNSVPINGTGEPQMFTVSLWFKGNEDGTLFDASDESENRAFRISLNDDDVVWEYTDRDGTKATATAEIDTGDGVSIGGPIGGPDPIVPIPGLLPDWHHVTAVGGWNNNKTQVFVYDSGGVDIGSDSTEIGGKPMQDSVSNDGRLGSIKIGANLTSSGSVDDGFEGRVDDVRIYHKDLSDTTISTTVTGTDTPLDEDFESGTEPSGWVFDDSEIVDSSSFPYGSGEVSNSGDFSGRIDGDDKYIETKGFDLSSAGQATLDFWVKRGDDSILNKPENYEELEVQYEDASGTYQDLREYHGPGGGSSATLPSTVLSEGEETSASLSLPGDAIHSNTRIRFYMPGGFYSGGTDNWYIDDLELSVTNTSTSATGSVGFVDDIVNDTSKGYVTTEWQNFTDDSGLVPEPVGSGSLRLENVEAEIGDGEVSVWVQSDTDNDDVYEEQSNEIVLDGTGEYDVNGLSTNNERFRLRVSVDHPDTTDTPKFYDAQLTGST